MEEIENLLSEPESEYKSNDFTDLQCWQKCRELRNEISKLTRTFPTDEKYRLTDQLIRSGRSATANIAEGFGRYHFKESIKFYFNARGSLYEIKDHLLVALDESYIDSNTYESLESLRSECTKILNGYIRFIVKASKNQ